MRHPRTTLARPRPPQASVAVLAVLAAVLLPLVPVDAEADPIGAGGTPTWAELLAVPDRTSDAVVRPVPGHVIRPFDPPRHPYGPGHRGVDLDAPPGAPVVAAMDGTVTFASDVAGTGWITIRHGPALATTYGDVDPVVAAGALVRAGAVIGVLRPHVDDPDTAHLDWGARDAQGYLDPMRLLVRWRAHLAAPTLLPRGQVVRR